MVYFMAKSHWSQKEREEAKKDAKTQGKGGKKTPAGYSKGRKVTDKASWTR